MNENPIQESLLYLERIVRLEEKIIANEKALTIASESLKHNQEVSNEWRKENIDQRNLFLTIEKGQSLIAVEAAMRNALDVRINNLEKFSNIGAGRIVGLSQFWNVLITVLALSISILALWKR